MMEHTDNVKDDELWEIKLGDLYKDEDDDDWRARRAQPISDPNTIKANQTEVEAEEYRCAVVASLVPDEVIYHADDYNVREFEGCLLFGDVSGFTDLCEKYNRIGSGGPSRLTQVLNNYIGAMVQEIFSHNGDVLKFSGDAFIAVWKVTDRLSMRDAIHEVLDCALIIQKSYGFYYTDVGVTVRVKLAVTSGNMHFSLIGDSENTHYLASGGAVWDLKGAESRSSAGEIVVTADSWKHVSANEYLAEVINNNYLKVTGIGPSWRGNTRDTFPDYESGASSSKPEHDVVLQRQGSESDSTQYVTQGNNEGEYSLRPAVNWASKKKMKNVLGRFIMAPVMKVIDLDEPLESLTEMRQVVVLFMNIVVPHNISPKITIGVANETYIKVCKLCKKLNGIVNKVNNFDKDLMMLVIFGLRGFKHEQEGQIALQCAAQCYQIVSEMSDVKGVSIGVTTGSTYCGAFGHSLRREYTVISLIVNKAARLMCAYPNKVTCDRETFLRSTLESSNFILQPHKELKGIINPGPIYEFKEIYGTHRKPKNVSRYPLLGRDKEMNLYLNTLNTVLSHSKGQTVKPDDLEKPEHTFDDKDESLNEDDDDDENFYEDHERDAYYNSLFIFGDRTLGKTRLVEEMIFRTPPEIPVNRLNFTYIDYAVSYEAIKEAIYGLIGIPENAEPEQIQEKVTHRLSQIIDSDAYCFMNEVLRVKCPETSFYQQLRQSNQHIGVIKEIVKKLFVKIFKTFWVLIIDGGEFIDESSWPLFELLIDLNLSYIVVSIDTKVIKTSKPIDKILKKPNVKKIILTGIEKWFHIGLICQILKTYAIPPELEKVVHSCSGGIPGWIANFVVSLVQSGNLLLTTISRQRAIDQGLALVPLYMMNRMKKDEIKLYEELLEERYISEEGVHSYDSKWKLYVESCRNSYTEIRERFVKQFRGDALIQICKLGESFNISDVTPALSEEIRIMKTFDSLTSYEQMLLKSSSILGDTFLRSMLLYILKASDIQYKMAQAVQKLFEMRVLCCARGDFINGNINADVAERSIGPDEDVTVKCECKGLSIHETCKHLPKYASCGYLRFKSSAFRDITITLLTNVQEKEFHSRAVRYLEKETKRCRACGNGFFNQILGTKDERTLKSLKSSNVVSSYASFYGGSDFEGRPSLTNKPHYSVTSDDHFEVTKTKKDSLVTEHLSGNITPYTFRQTIDKDIVRTEQLNDIGFRVIKLLRDNAFLARTFSNSDFSQCECSLILDTMYAQMIKHCTGSDNTDKILNVMEEYVYICLENRNVPQAMMILKEALYLLEGKLKKTFEMQWQVEMKRGKFHMLLANGLLKIGQYDDCFKFLNKALRCYGKTMPTSKFGVRLATKQMKLRQSMWLFVFPNRTIGTVRGDVAEYCNALSELLSLFCRYYLTLKKWDYAELVAIWSLNRAVKAQSNFNILCTAYRNMIVVAQHNNQFTLCEALEVYALKFCHFKNLMTEAEEMKKLSEMYLAIFTSRALRLNLEQSVNMGFLIWRIGITTKSEYILMKFFPRLFDILLKRLQITECVNILHEIDYYATESEDSSGKLWYFAHCLQIQIEIGCTVEPYSAAENYYQSQGGSVQYDDSNAPRRFIILMWLWCVRNQQWEAATSWEERAWDFETLKSTSLMHMFSMLYLLEALLLFFACKLDNRNFEAVKKSVAKIEILKKIFKSATKSIKVIQPRYLHLMAYYNLVKHNDYAKAFDHLLAAKKSAEAIGNLLEISWIEHTKSVWMNTISEADRHAWRKSSEPSNCIDYHEIELNEGSLIHFSLQPPIFT